MLAVILVSEFCPFIYYMSSHIIFKPMCYTVKISMHHVIYGRPVVVVLVIHIAHWFENNMTAGVEWHKSCGYSCDLYKTVLLLK